jgi:hypothetical protein
MAGQVEGPPPGFAGPILLIAGGRAIFNRVTPKQKWLAVYLKI